MLQIEHSKLPEVQNNSVELGIRGTDWKCLIGLIGRFVLPLCDLNSEGFMNSVQDVRWEQRFQNYERVLAVLSRGLQQREYNELERQGLIQAFEYCYELAWKTLQDNIIERGFVDIAGPRPVLQKAFELGLISNGHEWMQMVKT